MKSAVKSVPSADLLISYRPSKDAETIAVNQVWCEHCTGALRRAGAWGIHSQWMPIAARPERCADCGTWIVDAQQVANQLAYHAGHAGWLSNGKVREDNPHFSGTSEHREWDRGWKDAFQENS